MDSILVILKWVSNLILQISVGITWLCASLLVLVYSVIFLRVLVYMFNRFIRKESPQNDYIPMEVTYSREFQTPHRSQMRNFPEEEEEDWEEVCFKYAEAV